VNTTKAAIPDLLDNFKSVLQSSESTGARPRGVVRHDGHGEKSVREANRWQLDTLSFVAELELCSEVAIAHLLSKERRLTRHCGESRYVEIEKEIRGGPLSML
jgi:hypothetical protein